MVSTENADATAVTGIVLVEKKWVLLYNFSYPRQKIESHRFFPGDSRAVYAGRARWHR